MSLKIVDSASVVRTIRRLSPMDETDTLRQLQQLSLKDAGGTLRAMFSDMTADASPITAEGSISSPIPMAVTTSSTTATPTGGIGPYTYQWSIFSVDSGTWAVDDETADTTTFTCSFVVPGGFGSAKAVCVVTDSLGTVANTNDVVLSAQNTG